MTRNLTVTTLHVLAYHTSEVPKEGTVLHEVFQIFYAERALFAFLAFFQAELHGVTIFAHDANARLYKSHEYLEYGHLFPLPVESNLLLRSY